MFEISGVGIVAAFLGGAISFLSPCVLPLAPGYVSYIAIAACSSRISKNDIDIFSIVY